MKNETPHNAARDCAPIDNPTGTPRPRFWTVRDFLQQFEPSRLVYADGLEDHLTERTAWLAETERNVYRQEPMFRADGERVFDIGLLYWSEDRALAGGGAGIGGLMWAGGVPEPANELLDNLNHAEVEMEQDIASGKASPEQTAARREAILAADRRLLEMGVYRAEALGWGPRLPIPVSAEAAPAG